jgi:hypothetical protein
VNSRPQPHQPQHPKPELREYLLSEVLRQVAALAPTLKEAELRTLLHLTATALASGATSILASSREIALATKCSRRNVQHALDALSTRGLIAVRQGTATKAAGYLLRFLEVTAMGGATTTPPLPKGSVEEVALFQRQGGVEATPPPTDSTELTPAPSRIDSITPDQQLLLDRVLCAKSNDAPRDQLQEFATIVEVYSARLGRVYEHRPDVECCAQLIAACQSKEILHTLIFEMHRARTQPGESPMWWVTCALHRLHGIPARVTAARRAELKALRPRPTIVRAANDPPGADELKRAIAKAAAAKKL